MKNYIYVSAAKLDMMAPQIPRKLLDKIAVELTIDLKVASVRVSGKPATETLFSKLDLVVEYLRRHEKVGGVDSPEEYFGGVLLMRWGQLGHGGTIYFGGRTESTVLGLGGSIEHLVGGKVVPPAHAGPQVPARASSLMPFLVEVLHEELDSARSQLLEGHSSEMASSSALAAIQLANDWMKGPAEKLEFLAMRLLSGPARRDWPDGFLSPSATKASHVLLGTPIYVARVS